LPLFRPVDLPESLENFKHKNSLSRCEGGARLLEAISV